jgi:lysophospholipase L1-like esterase
MKAGWAWAACGFAAWTVVLAAQSAPARSPAATQDDLQKEVDAYRRLLNDWAGLTRYGSEDSEIAAPKAGETRVVFLGDEITEYWTRIAGHFFPGQPYLNRGIAGQTTAQMLVRFRQDVIALAPRVVVIEGGTNDVAGIGGPGTRGTLIDNVASMTDLAGANGIRIVLAAITPVCDCYTDQTTRRAPRRIADFNDVIKAHAAKIGAVYLDYYSALAEGQSFKKTLTTDGLLPNEAGYTVMATLAEQAIARAMTK